MHGLTWWYQMIIAFPIFNMFECQCQGEESDHSRGFYSPGHSRKIGLTEGEIQKGRFHGRISSRTMIPCMLKRVLMVAFLSGNFITVYLLTHC
jgi:hypothetical protein